MSSSPGSSDEDIPIANLKRPTRRQVFDANESSDEEEDIPLSELAKQARQSVFSAHSPQDEDDDDDEEEEDGYLSDTKEPWGGVIDSDILPPVLSWFGMVAKLLKKLIQKLEPRYGGVATVIINGGA